jgi:hypothetical protein
MVSPDPRNGSGAGRGAYAIRATPGFLCLSVYRQAPNRRQGALMRINLWIVLVVLMALLAVTQILRYRQDTQRICADDPSASVCGR